MIKGHGGRSLADRLPPLTVALRCGTYLRRRRHSRHGRCVCHVLLLRRRIACCIGSSFLALNVAMPLVSSPNAADQMIGRFSDMRRDFTINASARPVLKTDAMRELAKATGDGVRSHARQVVVGLLLADMAGARISAVAYTSARAAEARGNRAGQCVSVPGLSHPQQSVHA
jgi:hypothetical protein